MSETTIEIMIAGTDMNRIIADQKGMNEIETEIGIMVITTMTETGTQMRILMTRASEMASLTAGSTA